MKATELVVKAALSAPGAALDRFLTRYLGHSLIVWLFDFFDDVPHKLSILLVTHGHKSGLERHAVLPVFDAGAGRVAIVGSRGGSPVDPHWAHNLRARSEAAIYLRRRRHAVRVHLARGEDREALWEQIVQRAPIYGAYQAQASSFGREIPVFVLERTDGEPISEN